MSKRQEQIALMLGTMPRKRIASALHLSVQTVDWHVNLAKRSLRLPLGSTDAALVAAVLQSKGLNYSRAKLKAHTVLLECLAGLERIQVLLQTV